MSDAPLNGVVVSNKALLRQEVLACAGGRTIPQLAAYLKEHYGREYEDVSGMAQCLCYEGVLRMEGGYVGGGARVDSVLRHGTPQEDG